MSVMNISGLASGLDTENIIKQLMDIERVPLARLEGQKTATTALTDIWTEIANRLSTLNSRLTDLKLNATFQSRTTTISAENVLTASATTAAEPATYSIDIQQTAKAHSIASDPLKIWTAALEDDLSTADGFSLTGDAAWYEAGGYVYVPYNGSQATSGSLVSANALLAGQAQYIRAEWENYQNPPGTEITYYYSTDDGATWTVIDPADEGMDIALASPASTVKFKAQFYNNKVVTYPFLTYYKLEAMREIASSELDTALGLEGGFTFHVQSEPGQTADVIIEATDSARSIRDKINLAAEEQGVAIKAILIDNRLVITATQTGSESEIILSDGAEGVLARLGLLENGGGVKNELVAARDAVIAVNGVTGITRSSNVIDDVISGVALNLQDTGTVNLTVSRDTQKARDAIQAFLDQYNLVMDYVGSQVSETGGLRGDLTLLGIQNNLRRLASINASGINGSYKNLVDLGIGSGAISSQLTFDRLGKLSIVDADKLDPALGTDPDAVQALFFTSSEVGLAVEFSNYTSTLTKSSNGIIAIRKDGLDRLVRDLNKQIERLNDRLAREEEKLNAQFTALEKALSVLQSQGAWLTSQIASLQAVQLQSK